MSAMSLGELFVKMGFKVDNLEALKQFDDYIKKTALHSGEADVKTTKWTFTLNGLQKKLKDTVGTMNAYRMEMVAAAAAIIAITKKSSDYAAELSKFSNITGISSVKLQEWQQQAAGMGISGQEVEGTIKSLMRARTDMELGQGDPGPWKLLGLDPRQDPMKLLDQLGNKLNQMPKGMAMKVAADIGISEDMQNFLMTARKGNEGDKSLLLSEKEIKRLKEFNMLFNRVWDNAKRSLDKFAVIMAPIAELIMNSFNRLLKGATTLTEALQKIWDGLGPVKAAFIAFGVAMFVALFPVEALLLGVVVALEDFATWLRGGDSYFEEFLDKIQEMINKYQTLKDLVGWFNKHFDGIIKMVSDEYFKQDIAEVDASAAAGRMAQQQAGIAGSSMSLFGARGANQSPVSFNFQNQIVIDGGKSTENQAAELSKEFQKQVNGSFFQMPMPERSLSLNSTGN